MRLPLSLCMVLWLPGLVVSAGAQQPLTEGEALARVSLGSPRARAIRAQADLVRADALAARRFANPSVTASREAVSGTAERYLLFSQTLPITGRRALQIASAGQDVAAADLRVDDSTRRLRADARRAFVDLSIEEALERELEGALGALRGLVDVLTKRENAGDAATFDRLRAEREALDMAAALSEAHARRASAQGQLAAFFYPTPDPSTVHAAPLSTDRAPLPPADALVARAEAARPDLQAFERDIESARLAVRAAGRSVIPEPQVVAGLKTSSVGHDTRGSVLSIVASIPLFDRARPERARGEARVLLATAERDALRAEVGVSVRALRTAAEERRVALDAYRQVSIPKSDELQRIAQVSYDAGERGILELLDAYRSAAGARLRLLELEATTAHAEIDLELATAVEIRK